MFSRQKALCRRYRQIQCIEPINERREPESGAESRRLLVDGVGKYGMSTYRRFGDCFDGVEQQRLAESKPSIGVIAPKPVDQHRRNGRIAWQPARQWLRHGCQRHVA